MSPSQEIDWSECRLVETKPGVHSGQPVVHGTRLPAAAIIGNFAYGVSPAEISEQFEIPFDMVHQIVAYAQGHAVAHPV